MEGRGNDPRLVEDAFDEVRYRVYPETPLSEVVGRTRPVDISLFEDVAQIFFA